MQSNRSVCHHERVAIRTPPLSLEPIWTNVEENVGPIDGLRITAPDFPQTGQETVIVVQLDSAGRPSIVNFSINAPASSPVRSGDLRTIPLAHLVSYAMAGLDSMQNISVTDLTEDQILHTVADTYQAAVAEGEKGLEVVARRLGIAQSSAANRIREARAAGYLPPRDRRRQKTEQAFDSGPEGSHEGSHKNESRPDSAVAPRSRRVGKGRSGVVS